MVVFKKKLPVTGACLKFEISEHDHVTTAPFKARSVTPQKNQY